MSLPCALSRLEFYDVPEIYIPDTQIAARFGVHRSTVWRWANTDPTFPQPVKLSSACTRWKLADIEAWEAVKAAHTHG